MNAGAAIYTAGVAKSHKAGVERALHCIENGSARRKLDDFIAFSQKLKK
jgi:anthranilate phosphoribosyltransferase